MKNSWMGGVKISEVKKRGREDIWTEDKKGRKEG